MKNNYGGSPNKKLNDSVHSIRINPMNSTMTDIPDFNQSTISKRSYTTDRKVRNIYQDEE